MKALFIGYGKCSTCKKAQKWLEDNKIEFEKREITEEIPTKEELKQWLEMSNKDVKSFFNTSGLKYKELNLKEKLAEMNEDEKLELLASNGMLIKRPILIKDNIVLLGFKEKEWKEKNEKKHRRIYGKNGL